MKIKLNLGCGIHLYAGWINVDKFYKFEDLKAKKGLYKNAIVEKGAKYVQADIQNLPFGDNYADEVELIDTIEHFPMRNVVDYLKEIRRVMKPGAKLLIATTYFTGMCLDWVRQMTDHPFNIETYFLEAEVFYGNQKYFGEFHMTPFTPDFLNWCLVQAGFKEGQMMICRKGTAPTNHAHYTPDKGMVFRNDMLIAQAKK